MLFQQFYQTIKEIRNRSIFGINDLDTIFGKEKVTSNQLNRWQGKKYITKIKKGLYIFNDSISKIHPFLIANLGYTPSYISLETALHEYGFIPEVSQSVTSISTKKTYSFSALHTTFYYKKIKKDAFTGYCPKIYMGQEVLMAEPEKALLDFLYLRAKNLKQEEDIDGLRLNYFELRGKIDPNRLKQYALLFNSQTLFEIVSRIMKKI